jgi:hypothetical protein
MATIERPRAAPKARARAGRREKLPPAPVSPHALGGTLCYMIAACP